MIREKISYLNNLCNTGLLGSPVSCLSEEADAAPSANAKLIHSRLLEPPFLV